MKNNRRLIFLEFFLLTIFMGIFGLFIHSIFPFSLIAISGLILVCFIIIYRLIKNTNGPFPSLIAFFGIKPFTKKTILPTLLCLFIGFAFATALRLVNNSSFFPQTITLFALGIAPLIGMSEELLFRGYIQNRLYDISGPGAIILAAFSHTIYKCSLMILPALFQRGNIVYLGLWTFIGGIFFGILSKKSDTVYPALAGHAIFDIIVYSACETAPWWVW